MIGCCEQSDVARRAVIKAQESGGSVRLISRSHEVHNSATVDAVLRDMHDNRATSSIDEMSGFIQAWICSAHQAAGWHKK